MDPEISFGARKLARTPQIKKKKKKEGDCNLFLT
jgi:hypothetical protein